MFPNFNQDAKYNGNQRYVVNNSETDSRTGVTMKRITDNVTGDQIKLVYDKEGNLISNSKNREVKKNNK